MTTPPESSACLLCGAPSTLRCSACALKAGIDLFFCSKEHQKLVRTRCAAFLPAHGQPLTEEDIT